MFIKLFVRNWVPTIVHMVHMVFLTIFNRQYGLTVVLGAEKGPTIWWNDENLHFLYRVNFSFMFYIWLVGGRGDIFWNKWIRTTCNIYFTLFDTKSFLFIIPIFIKYYCRFLSRLSRESRPIRSPVGHKPDNIDLTSDPTANGTEPTFRLGRIISSLRFKLAL